MRGLHGLCAALCAAAGSSVQLGQHPGIDLSSHRFGALLQADTLLQQPPPARVNCTAFPAACRPPFNCHLGRKPQGENPIATADGHADYNTWCESPQYIDAALHCQQGDLRGYGRLMHQAQNRISTAIQSVDAHYCFAFGHCDNFEITPSTTLGEAEKMCDARFGHEQWTKMSKLDVGFLDMRISGMGLHLNKKAEDDFAQMACGMGNYHCDAIYCKQEFCSKDIWRIRWGKSRPKLMKKAHGKDYPKHY